MPEGAPSDISGATRILGLIADPVVHARSPAMMTEILREHGRCGSFVLLPM
jgi:shikimate 5-dehydrogenase